MATLKHIASKNADYGAAEQYLLFQHDEFTGKPILDKNGRLVPREDYRIATLNCGGKDETYIGNTIHNRWGTVSYKNKRMVRTPEEKCLRIEGTHEAIIEPEVFETVQRQIASRRRERKNKTMQIFSGLLKCADCGWAMRYCARTGERNPCPLYVRQVQGLSDQGLYHTLYPL